MTSYRVLGPLEVVRDGQTLDVGRGKQRALLAALALHANEPLSGDRLVDLLWHEPPATASKILQNCVMRLRRVLPPDVLMTRGHGYELCVGPGELDVDVFSTLLERGRAALNEGDHAAAVELLDGALALWRGVPLSDVGDTPFADEQVRRLAGLRLGAEMERADALLALGRHRELVAQLQGLVTANPFEERVRAQLMLALYRGGAQTQALSVYREGRRDLVEEFGVEPGPALRQLEQAILQQDSGLDLPPDVAARGVRVMKSRRWWAAAIAVAALAAGSAAFGLTRGGTDALSGEPPDSVAVIDAATGRQTADLSVPAAPFVVFAAAGTVWVAKNDGTLSEIDPSDQTVSDWVDPVTTNAFSTVDSLAYAGGAVWAADSTADAITSFAITNSAFVRLQGNQTQRHVQLGDGSDYISLAGGIGSLWIVSTYPSFLAAYDPLSYRVRFRVQLPGRPTAAAVVGRALWCVTSLNARDGLALRIDPTTRTIVSRVALPGVPSAVLSAFGRLWVVIGARNLVAEIDPARKVILRTIGIPGGPVAIAAGAGAVWVVAGRSRKLVRIAPATGEITRTVQLSGTPRAVTVSSGRVWVAGA